MSEAEQRHVAALIEIAQRRTTELTAALLNRTSVPGSIEEMTRWLDTITSIKERHGFRGTEDYD